MINPASINKFLNRKLLDLHDLKRVKREDYEKVMEKAGLWFRITPYLHQLACIYALLKYRAVLLFMDTGTGKTFVVLNAIWWLLKNNRIKRTLVLVPESLIYLAWETNIATARPELSYRLLYGSSKKRWEIVRNMKEDIAVLTYAGAAAMVSEIKQVVRNGKPVSKRIIQPSLLEELGSYFDFIVFDESTALKNPSSLTFKVCDKLGDGRIQYRVALSGTPFNREAKDLWSQFHAVDKGESLGYNFAFFREVFYRSKKEFWGGFSWVPRANRHEDLKRLMRNRSVYYDILECKDMPVKQIIPYYVKFDSTSLAYYEQVKKKMKEEFLASSGSKLPLKNLFIQARQITSGFINLKDSETGEIECIDMPQNPKLDSLLELMEEIDPKEKVLVFFEFTKSGEAISKRLKEAKIDHVLIHGKIKATEHERAKLFKSFITGTKRVLVINSSMGAYGHDGMQYVCRYAIFFETPVSSIVRHQAIARLYRTGQKERVFIYDLIVKDSVDERIMSFLNEGEDLQDFLLRDKDSSSLYVDRIL